MKFERMCKDFIGNQEAGSGITPRTHSLRTGEADLTEKLYASFGFEETDCSGKHPNQVTGLLAQFVKSAWEVPMKKIAAWAKNNLA